METHRMKWIFKAACCLLCLLVSPFRLQGADLKTILDGHAAALGGMERIEAVTTVEIVSRVEIGGMTGTARAYFKSPDKFRTDLKLPIMGYTSVCSGDDCWMIDSRGLVSSLGHELKRLTRTQMTFERALYLNPDVFDGEIAYTGAVDSGDGGSFHLIEVTPAGGATATIWLDSESLLISRIILASDFGLIHSELSDYRWVEGIRLPFRSSERTEAGLLSSNSTVEYVRINTGLSDTLFVPPDRRSQDESRAANSVSVDVEVVRNHIYVPIFLNGKGPFRFIFDTGAGGAAVDKRLIEELQLPRIGLTEAHGVGGAELSHAYRVDSLQLASLHLTELTIHALDFAPIARAGEVAIDGIIGYDLLSRYITTVDFTERCLTFHDPAIEPSENWGVSCPLTLDFRLPYIEATVQDTVTGVFRLDTGSHATIDFNAPFVQANNLADSDGDQFEITSHGIGGSSSGLLGILPRFEFCGLEFDSLWVNYTTSSAGVFGGAVTAGNIGSGLLKRLVVTFDYNNELVYFSPTPILDRWNKVRNMAGVGLEARGNSIVVVDVLPETAADGVLQPGDVLLRINDRSFSHVSLHDAHKTLLGGRGTTFDIRILREGKELDVKLRLDSFF